MDKLDNLEVATAFVLGGIWTGSIISSFGLNDWTVALLVLVAISVMAWGIRKEEV